VTSSIAPDAVFPSSCATAGAWISAAPTPIAVSAATLSIFVNTGAFTAVVPFAIELINHLPVLTCAPTRAAPCVLRDRSSASY